MMSGNRNHTASVRGGRKDSASARAKMIKRDFEMVSPASPENPPVTLANIRMLFKEELEPINMEFEDLRNSISFNSAKLDEIANLSTKVENLEKKCETLTAKLDAAEARCEQLEEKVVMLETYSRKNNVKFLGIKKLVTAPSAVEDCEKIIIELCQKIGLQIGPREIERAHRLGQNNNPNRPIIVKLSHFKDKQSILSKKQQFKDFDVTVLEDFPAEIQARRKIFAPVIQAAYRSSEHKAKLIGDRLLLDGRQYSVNDINKLPDDLRPENLCTLTNSDKIAFFTLNSKLSNHYSCNLTVNGMNFCSVEQYFMFCKAKEFGDQIAMKAIMGTKDAAAAKAIGSKIKNFDPDAWKKVRDGYMTKGLTAKFSQNENLKMFLKGTGKKLLIEGNAKDTYWASGLHLNDKDIWIPSRWKGKNQLGTLLSEVRGNIQ